MLRGGVVAVALVVLALVVPGTASAADCSLAPTGGTVKRQLGQRSYQLHVPADLAGKNVPLLLSLHGFGANGTIQETFTGWSQFAGSHDFIVAYPQAKGLPGSGAWNPYIQVLSDVGYLRDVVADISAQWCVDPQRVHVDGWSNGAVMSQRLACEAADLFASVTSYGGDTPVRAGLSTPCQPSRPISVGLFAGDFDFTYPLLGPNTDEWATRNACGSTPVHATDQYGSQDTYSCAAGTQVLSRVVKTTSHNWPFGAQAEDQRERMWAFFEANPLP